MNPVLDKLAVSVCLLFVSAAKRLAPMTIRNKIGKFVLCLLLLSRLGLRGRPSKRTGLRLEFFSGGAPE